VTGIKQDRNAAVNKATRQITEPVPPGLVTDPGQEAWCHTAASSLRSAVFTTPRPLLRLWVGRDVRSAGRLLDALLFGHHSASWQVPLGARGPTTSLGKPPGLAHLSSTSNLILTFAASVFVGSSPICSLAGEPLLRCVWLCLTDALPLGASRSPLGTYIPDVGRYVQYNQATRGVLGIPSGKELMRRYLTSFWQAMFASNCTAPTDPFMDSCKRNNPHPHIPFVL
jgi:hypothetical protein